MDSTGRHRRVPAGGEPRARAAGAGGRAREPRHRPRAARRDEASWRRGFAGERYPRVRRLYRHHFLAREDTMRLFPGMPQLLAAALRRAACSPSPRARAAAGSSARSTRPGSALLLGFALRRRDHAQAAPGDAARADRRARRGAGRRADDRRHHARPGDGARRAAWTAWRSPMARTTRRGCGACAPRGCVGTVEELGRWLSDNG